jgi:hypothetical protein
VFGLTRQESDAAVPADGQVRGWWRQIEASSHSRAVRAHAGRCVTRRCGGSPPGHVRSAHRFT